MREQRTYIGVKLIKATPMTRGEYNAHESLTNSLGGDSADEGYLVEYTSGYKSWSPKDVFDRAHLEIQNETTLGVGAAHAMLHDVTASKINDNALTVQAMCRNGSVFHETAYTSTPPGSEEHWNVLAEASLQKCLMDVSSHLVFMHNWALNGLGGAFELAPEKKLLQNTDLVDAAGAPLKLTKD